MEPFDRIRHQLAWCIAPLAWFVLAAVAGAGDLTPPAAAPPPMPQQSANCDRPTYASDQLVCVDAQLRAMDDQYRSLLGQQGVLASAAVWEEDLLWFRRRSRCAFEAEHRACLVQAYSDRIATVEAARSSAQAMSWRPVPCDGPWQGITVRAIRGEADDRIVFRDAEGVLAVAAPMPALGHWPPYLGYAMQGSGVTLRTVAGLNIHCHL